MRVSGFKSLLRLEPRIGAALETYDKNTEWIRGQSGTP